MKNTQRNNTFETSEALTIFNLSCTTSEAVIEELAALFSTHDIIYETFLDAVLARESTMPTGLLTKAGGVAIPHTDPEHVKRSAIAIGRLAEPVLFRNMANPSEQVEVNIVFLLAIAQKELVNPFLCKMAELLQDEHAFLKMLAMDNARDFIAYFSDMIDIGE